MSSKSITKLPAYKKYFEHLITLERDEEMSRQLDEIFSMSGRKRESKGRAVLQLQGRDNGVGVAGVYLVKLFRKSGIPKTEISIGDLVIVSSGEPNGKEDQAIVVEKTGFSFTIAYSSLPPHYVLKGTSLRLDLFANDVTFQRMKAALRNLHERQTISDLLLLKVQPEKIEEEIVVVPFNKRLNQSQLKAVKGSLEAKNLFLLHGPPGTGKTTTLVESILQHIKFEKKILATGDSNTSIDNLIEKLQEFDCKVLRIGNPARLNKNLLHASLDYQLQDHSSYQEASLLWSDVRKYKEEQRDLLPPSGQNRRGLSDNEIVKLGKDGSGNTRGIPLRNIRQMARWLYLQREVNYKADRAKLIEQEAIAEIIDKSDVVCATNSSAGSDILKEFRFSVVFIDEATQSVEPSCLIPMTMGRKWVLAGDHKQLPPTVLSKDAFPLSTSLFERWMNEYHEHSSALLQVQYRMNEVIMNFSNKHFYDNKLQAYPLIKNQTLNDLAGFEKITTYDPEEALILDPQKPLVFLDTPFGRDFKNHWAYSYKNEEEIEKVVKIVKALMFSRVYADDIGVISPYEAQVHSLKKALEGSEIEISTVDGFQGREKEIIIISFVRSNQNEHLGFLSDLRRLNVSITRAKKKLILIGNYSTLSSDIQYKELLDSCERLGR